MSTSSDVFALGSTALALCVGRDPFSAATEELRATSRNPRAQLNFAARYEEEGKYKLLARYSDTNPSRCYFTPLDADNDAANRLDQIWGVDWREATQQSGDSAGSLFVRMMFACWNHDPANRPDMMKVKLTLEAVAEAMKAEPK